jgi:hypothetical protein
VPPTVCDTAVLLTSEVVTNAFLHGRSNARLRVHTSAGRVRVEVGDDNMRPPHLAEPNPEATNATDVYLWNPLGSRSSALTDKGSTPLGTQATTCLQGYERNIDVEGAA